MNANCYGIYSGPWPPTEDQLIVNFGVWPFFFPEGKAGADLRVLNYANRMANQIVTIELRRKSNDALLWRGVVNNLDLFGPPKLWWQREVAKPKAEG